MTHLTKENMQKAHDELLKTFVDKNADYGNSFEESLDNYGLIAALIRMEDKLSRLRNLSINDFYYKVTGDFDEGAKVKDESISDTLRDLSNYALMASVWFDHKDESNDELDQQIEVLNKKLIDHLTELKDPDNDRMAKLFPNTGYYSGIKLFKPGEKTRFFEQDIEEPSNEIQIQNSGQLRLYLELHKEKGAISVAQGIGNDLFYRIDFTDFYGYIKEIRKVPLRKDEKFEIYFNVRNTNLNEIIYVRMNETFTAYKFFDTKEYQTALNQFIAYKQYLLDKSEHPHIIKAKIKGVADRQLSNILKPRVRIDDAFVSMMMYDYDDVTYEKNSSDYYKEFLNKQFIYDMFEGTTDHKYGDYSLVLNENGTLGMLSTPTSTLERFLSKSFLDSFQRKLDSGATVKLVKFPQ